MDFTTASARTRGVPGWRCTGDRKRTRVPPSEAGGEPLRLRTEGNERQAIKHHRRQRTRHSHLERRKFARRGIAMVYARHFIWAGGGQL